MSLKIALLWIATILVSQVMPANAQFSGHSHISLSISVSEYDALPDLPNADSDAQVITQRLTELGYSTFHLRNPNRKELLHTLAVMRLASSDASQVIIYLAGHGVQSGADTYFLTRETSVNPTVGVNSKGLVPLSTIVRAFSDKPRQKIILFDACRTPPELSNPPFLRATSAIDPAGLLLAYAAGMGQPAYDGSGYSSPFATALLRQMQHPERPLTEILRRVRLDVIRQTGGQQIPWVHSSLLRPAKFVTSSQNQ